MSDFEKKKEEYLEKLSTKTEFVKSLAKKDDERSRATLRVLVDPRDEKELKVATSTLDFTEDFLNLVTSAACGNVETVPVEENEGVKAIAAVMKMLISGEEVTSESITAKLNNSNKADLSPEKTAEIIYGMMVGFACDPEEAMRFICEELGVSLESEVDLIRLQVLLEESQAKMQAMQPNQNVYQNMTDKSVDDFVEFSEAFHSLCEKNIKKEDSTDLLVYKLLKDLR